MIPAGGTIINEAVQEKQMPSCTWKIDVERGRVVERIDNLEAIRQAVFKILQTERFDYVIYDDSYGNELKALQGMSPTFVKSEIKRRIKEAIMQDERVKGVEDISIATKSESMVVEFTVLCEYGSFKIAKEVG